MKNLKLLTVIILLFLALSVKAQEVGTTQISIGEQIEYKSNVLNDDVNLYIHLPKDYTTDRKYPVMYLLDGEYFFTQMVSTVEFLSNCAYTQQELIPKFIIVGIATKNRNKDFTPTNAPNQYGMPFTESGGAENFLEFMKKELFPYIEKKYSVNETRLLTGWSLGGLFTTYCYLNHPENFSYFLAVSPSLWWDKMVMTEQLIEKIDKNSLAKKKFTMTIGSLEKGAMHQGIKESFVPEISKAIDSTYFDFIEIVDESHSYTPFSAFYKGLQSIFYKWTISDNLLKDKNYIEIEKIIFSLAGDFGFTGDDIHGATYHLYITALSQGNYNNALKVAKFRAERFPESTYAQYNLGEMYYRIGDKENCLKHIKNAIKIEKAKAEPNTKRLKQYNADVKEISEEIKDEKRKK